MTNLKQSATTNYPDPDVHECPKSTSIYYEEEDDDWDDDDDDDDD